MSLPEARSVGLMGRRIRVKLDFVLVIDHEVTGIDDEWACTPFAMIIARALGPKLGIEAVESATRELSIVEPKPRRVRKPRPRISEDIRMEPKR